MVDTCFELLEKLLEKLSQFQIKIHLILFMKLNPAIQTAIFKIKYSNSTVQRF